MPDEPIDLTQHEPRAAVFARAAKWYQLITGTPADASNLAGLLWANAIAFANAPARADAVAPGDGWVSIGPRNVGGSVRTLAQDPDLTGHGGTFWAGLSGGGLWRTTDDGNTWESFGEAFFGVTPVCAIAVAPSDRNVIWVGTGEPHQFDVVGVGLWRSLNGGATFQKIASPGSANPGDADHFNKIVVHPTNPRIAWAATDTGLWRWDDTAPTLELPVVANSRATDVAMFHDVPNNQLILLAGIWMAGVQRGIYPLAGAGGPTAWTVSALTLSGGGAATNVGRVLVAFAPSNASIAYAMVHDRQLAFAPGSTGNGGPQRLYASSNGGVSFRQPAGAGAVFPNDTPSKQAHYSMALAVHPTLPNTVVAGHVNLYVSPNGGRTWTITTPGTADGWISWQNNLTFGTVAEHGDMHCILFDRRDAASATPRTWVGNDGGLSMTNQWVRPFNWRKRSYGILGAQAVDGTSHPSIPSMVGIGMQDNATFFSYGGPTWYQVGQADGGALAWHPTNVRRPFISWQNEVATMQIGTSTGLVLRQLLPEVAPTPGAVGNRLVCDINSLGNTGGASGYNGGTFRQLVVGDGVTANRILVSGPNGAFLSTTGAAGSFSLLRTGGVVGGAGVSGFTPTGAPPPAPQVESSALSFVPGSASNRDIWVGTTTGDIFAPPGAAAPAPAPWFKTNPFVAAGGPPVIACIAVHPANPQIVAVSAYTATIPLMLSHDNGRNWFAANGNAAANQLPNCPVTSLAWHPTDEHVLYAGTMVGVFVARDLPAFVAPGNPINPAPNPTWRTFNRGLGPIWVNDLEVVNVTNTLRATTFARGVYEASLTGVGGTYVTPAAFRVPEVRLSIRDTVFDDSRTYVAANQVGPGDVRLPAAAATPHLNGNQAFDIKVNAPELRDRTFYLQSERFGHSPDGAELDEQFVCETPISGDTNVAYVQVHNRGWKKADSVQCFLYVADAGAGAGLAPPLTGLGFPTPPGPLFAWQQVGQQSAPILPGQPRVFRFEWICPVEITQNVALLAICRSSQDELAATPTGPALAFATAQRQVALRILPVVPDRVFIRDGLDDTGQRGAVVWGGRSPDIIVMTKTAADAISQAQADNNTTSPFANLNDARRGDRVRPGNNTIIVRVHNRGAININARVRLYRVPLNQIQNGGAWTQIGTDTNVNAIAARTWKTARFQITGVPADGVAGATQDWQKAFVFAAIVRATNPTTNVELESFPDVTTVTGLDEFWSLFNRGALANNAAFRALRFLGGP